MSAFPRARPQGQHKAAPRTPVVHVFAASGATNHNGVSICDCGSLVSDRVHELPELTEDERALAERIVGES